jgi:hypothetical protein
MAPGKLTAFQRAFFQRERGFFLTGGAALAGFHLGHRTTEDLDLFTLQQAAFERSRSVLADVAAAVGAVLEVRQDTRVHKRRSASSRGGLVVDLVKDMTWQLHPEKLERDHIVVDPADEILANKLHTIRTVLTRRRGQSFGPPEERDLVDVMLLERLGYSVEAVLPATLAKNGGCTPATLVGLLSEVKIPDGIELPAGVPPAELRAYLAELIRRLLVLAAPEEPGRP